MAKVSRNRYTVNEVITSTHHFIYLPHTPPSKKHAFVAKRIKARGFYPLNTGSIPVGRSNPFKSDTLTWSMGFKLKSDKNILK